jgi:hypothetical protein
MRESLLRENTHHKEKGRPLGRPSHSFRDCFGVLRTPRNDARGYSAAGVASRG